MFPAFWGKNLQNSAGYETPYENTQIKYLAKHVYGRMTRHTHFFFNLVSIIIFLNIVSTN